MNKPFNEIMSLVVVANDYPDDLAAKKAEEEHPGEMFKQLYLRWSEFFDILPEASEIEWHRKIDFEDGELFYKTMRMLVESDVTPGDVFEDLVAAVDGITLRWRELIALVDEIT